MPEFALRDLGQARDSGYEFEVHRREREIAVARVTRVWGWSARWSWREDATEYFQLWRELLFRRSLTMVRGHTVSELNRLLRRVGIDAELDVVQSASVHSIDGALERLAKGEWDFVRATQEAGSPGMSPDSDSRRVGSGSPGAAAARRPRLGRPLRSAWRGPRRPGPRVAPRPPGAFGSLAEESGQVAIRVYAVLPRVLAIGFDVLDPEALVDLWCQLLNLEVKTLVRPRVEGLA